LKRVVEEFFKSDYRSRGRVIVRKLVKLKHSRYTAEGFPLGREYRVFLLNDRVVGHGYYWEGADPLKELSKAEEAEVLRLAERAAQRLKVPFIAVDVGQQEDESWTVIEVNDAQFAGTSQIPALLLWNAILGAINNQ
jgi:ATP-grasp domain, R2K clade family 3